MNAISLICFLISLAIVVSCFRRNADIFSPGRVFGLVWSLAFGLTELKLSGLQHVWSFESWVIVLLGPLTFLVGTFTSHVLNMDGTMLPLSAVRDTLRRQEINERLLFFLTVASALIYLLSYAIIYFVKGFVPIFSQLGPSSRRDFSLFGIGIFIQSVPFIVFCTVLYHVYAKAHRGKKWILKGLALLCMVTYILLLQRFPYMMTAVVCMCFLYYTTKHVRARTLILSVLVIAGLFYWVSTLRAGELIQYFMYSASKMKFSPDYALLTEPYMYVVMNLENFSRAAPRLDQLAYGNYSFDFLLALTGLKHWLREYFALVDSPYLVSGYNTYTAFWTFYRDFGMVGLFVIPLLSGFGIASQHYTMRRKPTLSNVTWYCVLVFAMMISFFNHPFAFLWFVYVVAVLFLIMRAVVLRSQPSASHT